MKVQCPHCGGMVEVNNLGRKAFNIPVKNVCDAIQLHHSITEAANELGCSRAYIYKVLKAAGLSPVEVIKGLAVTTNPQWRKGNPITELIWQSMTSEQRRQASRGKGIVPIDIEWGKLSKDQKRFLKMRTTTFEHHATKDTGLLHKEGLNDGR